MQAKPCRRSYLVRSIALLWSVAGPLVAAAEAFRVWSALLSGQARFLAIFGAPAPFSRADDPDLFHAALVCSMLIAVFCLFTARRAWQYQRAALPLRGPNVSR